MANLATSMEWNESDLVGLIDDGVEENINLDYKRCSSLQKGNAEKREISKDISAFANSAGGIVIYGMIEENHKPTAIDAGYDPTEISKEWVEQVIQSNIRPRITGVHINPVSLSGSKQGRYAYIITIPPGKTAHQAADFRYYKRFNFESIPMYDHEVRDIMSRCTYPLVSPIFSLTLLKNGSLQQYKLNIALRNLGATCARDVKLIFFWLHPFCPTCGSGFRQKIIRGRISVPTLETDNIELTVLPFNRPIFPED